MTLHITVMNDNTLHLILLIQALGKKYRPCTEFIPDKVKIISAYLK